MNPYSVNKLAAHPEVLNKLRETGEGDLLTVHLMPQNVCNHRCSFCSYRMPNNKNSEDFDESKHIPWDDMVGLLSDFRELGVQGIELTGGGEPLAYPHITKLLRSLGGFAVGLVSNGSLLHRIHDPIQDVSLRWARISIDAASKATYVKMRKAPPEHFDRAWDAVRWLANHRDSFHSEFQVGVGFVASNENLSEVTDAAVMAKDYGADNIRLSMTFADSHLEYFTDQERLKAAVEESREITERLSDDNFTVHNLLPTRYSEQVQPFQDYRRCPTKDVLCVVEGEGRVYSCCTLTGSTRGLYGNFIEHPGGFMGVWKGTVDRRRKWDSRVECPVACLYRERNLAMNELIDQDPPIHVEFI